jgi:hypothetical protein
MLAEIAAANAAFSVIKTALSNGKELFEVGEHATKYFDNKSVIAKKSNAHGNKNELAAFMELQKLRKQEEWLKEHMIYAGDPGMWDAWLKFQSDCKRNRERQAAIAKRKKIEDRKNITLFLKVVGVIIVVIPLIAIVAKLVL